VRENPRVRDDIVVVDAIRPWSCARCGASDRALLTMHDDGPLCLTCAGLDDLEYLPRGDAAVTRRARRHSERSAVVVRFSRARKRYERQGVLVEAAALERAEAESAADAAARDRCAQHARAANETKDARLRDDMAHEIRRLFPGCPAERAAEIAAHTARRGSGRVGRSAAGRALEPRALELAVAAAVRHLDTDYDEVLAETGDRAWARMMVGDDVARILDGWRAPGERRT
jgi:hypothetical protein